MAKGEVHTEFYAEYWETETWRVDVNGGKRQFRRAGFTSEPAAVGHASGKLAVRPKNVTEVSIVKVERTVVRQMDNHDKAKKK